MKRHFNAKFDIETEQLIGRLYQEGVQNGTVVLSKRFNCNYGTIIAALRSQGVRIRTNAESQKGLRSQEDHPNFKGGSIGKTGYKRIYVDGNLMLEHRHVVEQKLGRKLDPKEIVHHINHDKLDNRIENLQLVTRAEHAIMHESWKHLPQYL